MARYWVYLNDVVSGPFALEQLIRQRGFSRQTLICVDDASGKPTHWISPAEIPELAHIFKAVDEQNAVSPAPAPAKMSPRPAARPVRAYTPAVTLKAPARDLVSSWAWAFLAVLLLGGAGFAWFQYMHRGDQSRDQEAAKRLVENAPLPAPSPFGTMRQYLQDKQVNPKWEFERVEEALYHVTLSWYAPPSPVGGPMLTVYAFEANLQAQTVRGLNTAATKLLSEGFPAPQTAKPKAAALPKKAPVEQFAEQIESRRDALERGDFSAVWGAFSQRKKAEMSKGGISRDGFLRVQNLTHRVESALKQTVLKTKAASDTEQLVLLKQSQPGRPDIFVKQLWVYEEGSWKLDDEQKRSAPDSGPRTQPNPSDNAVPIQSKQSPETSVPSPVVAPAQLPGMSH